MIFTSGLHKERLESRHQQTLLSNKLQGESSWSWLPKMPGGLAATLQTLARPQKKWQYEHKLLLFCTSCYFEAALYKSQICWK